MSTTRDQVQGQFGGESIQTLTWLTSFVPVLVTSGQEFATAEAAATKPSEHFEGVVLPGRAVSLALDSCPLLMPSAKTFSMDDPQGHAKALDELSDAIDASQPVTGAATAHAFPTGILTLLAGILSAIQSAGGLGNIATTIIGIIKQFGGLFGGTPAPTAPPATGS